MGGGGGGGGGGRTILRARRREGPPRVKCDFYRGTRAGPRACFRLLLISIF